MNRFILMCGIVVGLALAAQGTVTFSDSFETYADGAFPPAPNWSGFVNGAMNMDANDVGAIAYDGSKVFRAYRATSLNAGGSGAIATTDAVKLRTSIYPGLYVLTAYVRIGTVAYDGVAMCSSIVDVQTQNAAGAYGTRVGFYGRRYYAQPEIRYYDGETFVQDSLTFPTNTWMKVVTILNEIDQKWSFEITNAHTGALVHARTGLAFTAPDFRMNNIRLYFQNVMSNDGLYNMVDAVEVESLPTVSETPRDCREVRYRNQLLTADVNADCEVNMDDLALLAASWLKCNNPEDPDCQI